MLIHAGPLSPPRGTLGLRLMHNLLGGPLFHLFTRGEPDRLDILVLDTGVHPQLARRFAVALVNADRTLPPQRRFPAVEANHSLGGLLLHSSTRGQGYRLLNGAKLHSFFSRLSRYPPCPEAPGCPHSQLLLERQGDIHTLIHDPLVDTIHPHRELERSELHWRLERHRNAFKHTRQRLATTWRPNHSHTRTQKT